MWGDLGAISGHAKSKDRYASIVFYSLGRHKVENVSLTNNCFLMFFLKKGR